LNLPVKLASPATNTVAPTTSGIPEGTRNVAGSVWSSNVIDARLAITRFSRAR
jgi:hypothetical protein